MHSSHTLPPPLPRDFFQWSLTNSCTLRSASCVLRPNGHVSSGTWLSLPSSPALGQGAALWSAGSGSHAGRPGHASQGWRSLNESPGTERFKHVRPLSGEVAGGTGIRPAVWRAAAAGLHAGHAAKGWGSTVAECFEKLRSPFGQVLTGLAAWWTARYFLYASPSSSWVCLDGPVSKGSTDMKGNGAKPPFSILR